MKYCFCFLLGTIRTRLKTRYLFIAKHEPGRVGSIKPILWMRSPEAWKTFWLPKWDTVSAELESSSHLLTWNLRLLTTCKRTAKLCDHCCVGSLHSLSWEPAGEERGPPRGKDVGEGSCGIWKVTMIFLEGIWSRMCNVNTDIEVCLCRGCSGLVLRTPQCLFFVTLLICRQCSKKGAVGGKAGAGQTLWLIVLSTFTNGPWGKLCLSQPGILISNRGRGKKSIIRISGVRNGSQSREGPAFSDFWETHRIFPPGSQTQRALVP